MKLGVAHHRDSTAAAAGGEVSQGAQHTAKVATTAAPSLATLAACNTLSQYCEFHKRPRDSTGRLRSGSMEGMLK